MNCVIYTMDKFLSIYNFFKTDKKKERFDIILEPLQAITQLALMAFCPYGSKLSIANNLLFIQSANWGQGVLRSFNNDKRDDLFYLFNSIIRFNKFYSFLKANDNSNKTDKLLYDLLIRLSKKGIDNILQTYSNVDEPSLLHTLQMYKTLLDNPNLIMDNDSNKGQRNEQRNEGQKNEGQKNEGQKNEGQKNDKQKNEQRNETQKNEGQRNEQKNEGQKNEDQRNDFSSSSDITKKNIDDVFIKIRDIYSIYDRNMIFNILTLIEKRPEYYENYILGLNNVMEPINVQIKKWINDNIVY
jgi:hypothetical protein